ncbi:unnamed protein product [Urochloa decumbens]|uniref:Cupin type-1 domain-containing protein n=1 Tax=Urochloa decumbens TaxID=240449 RepID=A0ABC8XMR4_9POAL
MAGASARWLVLLLVAVSAAAAASSGKHERWRMSGAVGGQVVEKERRRVVADAEAGTVTAVDVADAVGTAYRLHFIAMDPGALFLPVQLHADMVFYVHSGRGKVTYIEEDSGEQSSLEVERGDVYNLEQGSILYIQSYPNATRQRLRIYAIFTSEGINADDPWKPKVEAYSSVSNLLKGFETEVLRLGFGVQREVAEAIKSAKTPPSIIPYNPEEKGDDDKPKWTEDIVDALLGVRDPEDFLNKKKKKDKHKHKEKGKKSKSKAFNFYSGKPDVHNCYGWSKTMTNKDLDALHGSNIGMFIVNLTTGSMMGPHWNPKATEIAIVIDGSGIVQTVCPSSNPSDKSRRGRHHGDERRGPGGRGDEGDKGSGDTRGCRNAVFRVKEGDVFVVPRFHPMAQMSFNNDSFVFVGFSTHMGQNHPQFLAGKGSVLQAIGKEVLSLSLGQKNSSAVEKLLSAQRDSTILSCISCAEELEEKAAEEERRRQEEEERKEKEERERKEREEEERREKEEKERKEREEEERRKEKEEKERKQREEEERRREQEERERREREEEEQRRREQEEREREEEEERQRRKEEERARREEEEREREEEERRREEEEGGGGRGDEPERDEEEEGGDEPPYRLSKKVKKRHRVGMFRSG